MLAATAIASSGSNGFHPVSITRPKPATTPEASQAVGEHVLTVGLEDERVAALSHLEEVPAQSSIEDASGEQEQRARAQVLQLQVLPIHFSIVATRIHTAARTIMAPSKPAEKNVMRSYP